MLDNAIDCVHWENFSFMTLLHAFVACIRNPVSRSQDRCRVPNGCHFFALFLWYARNTLISVPQNCTSQSKLEDKRNRKVNIRNNINRNNIIIILIITVVIIAIIIIVGGRTEGGKKEENWNQQFNRRKKFIPFPRYISFTLSNLCEREREKKRKRDAHTVPIIAKTSSMQFPPSSIMFLAVVRHASIIIANNYLNSSLLATFFAIFFYILFN